ncbi:hypothetical protein J2736_003894 [Paenibacillus qinlingensis]|uniref:Uncharacterized protein n=1 Tax=Paenibacillus qinlingensis TaxID=1837343 RepID=A0ABU1NYW2_9BACL|nr:hypothetical protein [Paenibacillus qinlingensis]
MICASFFRYNYNSFTHGPSKRQYLQRAIYIYQPMEIETRI